MGGRACRSTRVHPGSSAEVVLSNDPSAPCAAVAPEADAIMGNRAATEARIYAHLIDDRDLDLAAAAFSMRHVEGSRERLTERGE